MVLLDEAGLGRSAVQIFPASGRLLSTVEHGWIHEGPHPRNCWRIVPDCSGYVIFTASTTPAANPAQLMVVGARSHHADIDMLGRCSTIAVRLRPGTLSALTRTPASELTDRSVPLGEIVGRAGTELLERMATTDSAGALSHMTAFLEHRFSQTDHKSQPDFSRLLTTAPTVAMLSAATNLCQRALYERWRGDLGLAPKRALRIVRLHRALWLAQRRRTWSEIAAAAGFADQAHLTREMHALLGEPPGEWAKRGRAADLFKTVLHNER